MSDIDNNTLEQWLDSHLPGCLPIRVEAIKGGGSCELFSIERGEQQFVLRRAPLTAVTSTAHNVLREFHIVNAMQGSNEQIPKVYAACEDTEVAGAPFYLMEFIDGAVIRRALPQGYVDQPESQPRIGEELIDALVNLHRFDWRNSELADLGHPDQFLERQTQRWLNQYSGYARRDLATIAKTADWLDRHRPPSGELTVMHGDYKLDNTMMSHDAPPRVLKIVDFEMTTIGDPLIDVAWAMIFWPEEGNLIAIAAPGSGERAMSAAHCQTPQTLIQRYSKATGRALDNFQWYQAFAAWKLAIVLEASYAIFLNGESNNPNHEFFGFLVDQLLLRAERFAE